MNSKLKYYISEAFKSIAKNRITSLVSITTSVATMFILGVFIVLSLNVNEIASQVSRDCAVQVFISDECDEMRYDEIGEEIWKINNILDVEKHTKEEIFEEVKAQLGEKSNMLAGLENDNPYRNSYKINLTDLSYVPEVTQQLSKIEGIEVVSDVQSLASTIVSIVSGVKKVSLWLVVILCIITAFIVSNAIKVSVFARRKEINIMKYIGATDSFIRWPFIIEGAFIGVIGAFVSFCCVWLVYAQIPSKVSNQITFFELMPFKDMALIILGVFVLVGAGIGVVGSVMSLRKHLRV